MSYPSFYQDLYLQLKARKFSPSSAQVAISLLHTLGTKRGVNWEKIDEPLLLKLCPSLCMRRRLRIALQAFYPLEEARRRYPAVYARSGARPHVKAGEDPKRPTAENCLPKELLNQDRDSNPTRRFFERLFQRLVKRGGMTTVLSFRVMMSFLYGFLFSCPASLIPKDTLAEFPTEELLVEKLRSFNHNDIILAYDHYRSDSERLKHTGTSLETLSRHLSHLSVLFCDILKSFKKRLDPSDFGIIVASKRKKKHFGNGTADAASSMPSSACSSLGTAVEEMILDRTDSGWLRPLKSSFQHEDQIHCFTAVEVRALYLACNSTFEKLLMVSLFNTAMRIGGFCLAERRGVMTTRRVLGVETTEMGSTIWTTEKGNRRKDYPITPEQAMQKRASLLAYGMSKLLQDWVNEGNAGNHYLFPRMPGGDVPRDTRSVRKDFMRVAKAAGLEGHHVKPHTARHTVAWTLSVLGNSLEDVADFLGHRSTQVTKDVYVAMETAIKRSRMTIPWGGMEGGDGSEAGKQRLQSLAFELASALASPFASPDGRSFPHFQPKKKCDSGSKHVQFSQVNSVVEEEPSNVLNESIRRAEEKAERKQRARQRIENARQREETILARLESLK